MASETLAGTIVSIQVGKPAVHETQRSSDGHPVEWTSGILKSDVSGLVRVSKLNLEGDGQADLEHHGGPDRAILLYDVNHYAVWREELGNPNIPYGAFGENLTVKGLSEDTVCIGDVFRIGEVEVQVSQPRRPCWKLARRNGVHDLAERVLRHGWSGWYVRVLQEGVLEPGQTLVLTDRSHPEWTITKAHEIYSSYRENPEAARAFALCPYLSKDWRAFLGNA